MKRILFYLLKSIPVIATNPRRVRRQVAGNSWEEGRL